jgi:hypothetical protein
MSDKELASSLDEALAHVDPDRRKFLGILLAGVAAVPLLNSASLSAEDKPSGQKAEVFPKNATTVKGNTAINEGKFNTIKLNDQKTQTGKFWDKTSGSNAQIKGENSTIKLQPNAIKGENTQIKGANTQIKLSNATTLKNQASPIKGETKPAPH